MAEPPPRSGTRLGHVNVIARDWQVLAAFYESVFECTVVPPMRDYRGDVVERGTAVPNAAFAGVHLRLPGHGPHGPTLEIYTYEQNVEPGGAPTANRVGWGHIAFQVEDVTATQERVLEAGGSPVGEVVTTQTADGRHVTWCYMSDPEGNLVELQRWS